MFDAESSYQQSEFGTQPPVAGPMIRNKFLVPGRVARTTK